jgi:hypothetical protein
MLVQSLRAPPLGDDGLKSHLSQDGPGDLLFYPARETDCGTGHSRMR